MTLVQVALVFILVGLGVLGWTRFPAAYRQWKATIADKGDETDGRG
mgnify:CR=1 FL=1